MGPSWPIVGRMGRYGTRARCAVTVTAEGYGHATGTNDKKQPCRKLTKTGSYVLLETGQRFKTGRNVPVIPIRRLALAC